MSVLLVLSAVLNVALALRLWLTQMEVRDEKEFIEFVRNEEAIRAELPGSTTQGRGSQLAAAYIAPERK